jgi:hypothetical protein
MLFHCYAMGYRNKTTMHGFRGSFSTIAHEAEWPHEAIELQLAHLIGSKVSRAYDKSKLPGKRRELLQWWADKLDELRTRAERRQRILG